MSGDKFLTDTVQPSTLLSLERSMFISGVAALCVQRLLYFSYWSEEIFGLLCLLGFAAVFLRSTRLLVERVAKDIRHPMWVILFLKILAVLLLIAGVSGSKPQQYMYSVLVCFAGMVVGASLVLFSKLLGLKG